MKLSRDWVYFIGFNAWILGIGAVFGNIGYAAIALLTLWFGAAISVIVCTVFVISIFGGWGEIFDQIFLGKKF